ncbi:hypothetical protein ACHAW6_009909 [Cyclotella cf. meneghiniana]
MHYPAFHQMEDVKLMHLRLVVNACGFHDNDWLESPECRIVKLDLKYTLEGLMEHLLEWTQKRDETKTTFHSHCPPLNLKWMEVLDLVLQIYNHDDRRGWAFGLGLERLAMILFKIPNIRLFWMQDERFQSQFKKGSIVKFRPYSKYSPVFKDIVAFWTGYNTDKDDFMESDFFDAPGTLANKSSYLILFTIPKVEDPHVVIGYVVTVVKDFRS